jgi:hypothetical protein
VTVTEGEAYSFRHKAINQNGESDYSTTLETYGCTAPSQPDAPTGEDATTTSITLYWDAPADNGGCDVLYYQVMRNTGADDDVSVLIHSADL